MIRIWHPMRDPHHCSFRILAMLIAANNKISLARISILDTFMLFPEYLHDIKYTGHGTLRHDLRELNVPKAKDSFVSLPDIRIIYRELQVFQKAAIHQLVAKGILSRDSYSNGSLELIATSIPDNLFQTIETYIQEQIHKLNFIIDKLNVIPLDGSDGLFRRTGLELGGRFR